MCQQSLPHFPGIDQFITAHNLGHCQAARRCLLEGKSNYKGEEMSNNIAQRIFDVTSQFITLLDSLELGVTSVDGISPSLKQIYQTLKDYPNLPAQYKGTQCIGNWCSTL